MYAGVPHIGEQRQPPAQRDAILIAVLGDGHTLDQLHHEVRPAGRGGAGVQDPGDVRMVHQGQRLALGLEAGDDLPGVHAQLDDFDGHLAADRLLLLRQVDGTEPTLADALEQLVGPQDAARRFGRAVPGLGGQRDRQFGICVCRLRGLHFAGIGRE
jgi:hypothetical protein